MSPQTDMSSQFIEAMRAPMNSSRSAVGRGLSQQWDTDELKQRINHADHYLRLHNWNLVNEEDEVRIEEDDDDDEGQYERQRTSGHTEVMQDASGPNPRSSAAYYDARHQ